MSKTNWIKILIATIIGLLVLVAFVVYQNEQTLANEYVKNEICKEANYYVGGYMYAVGLVDMGYQVENFKDDSEELTNDAIFYMENYVDDSYELNAILNK